MSSHKSSCPKAIPRIILGSESPRRKQILSSFTLPFEQIPSGVDESTVSFQGDPAAFVLKISRVKAAALAKRYPDAIIITADTTVYKDDKVFEKPANLEMAFSFLSQLAGSEHSVFTGVTVQQGNKLWSDSEETRVFFNPLSAAQIRRYHQDVHCYDKAGGYAIQESGAIIVRRIEGCYYNVLGLPIQTVQRLLEEVGISLWDYLKS